MERLVHVLVQLVVFVIVACVEIPPEVGVELTDAVWGAFLEAFVMFDIKILFTVDGEL